MNEIIDVNEEYAYAVVEPGVLSSIYMNIFRRNDMIDGCPVQHLVGVPL
jgi:hypothetical protein